MRKIFNRSVLVILLFFISPLARSQYLIKLTFYDYSDKVGYVASVVFFKNTINDINVDGLLKRCQNVDSIFQNFGIPLIDPGSIPDGYGFECKPIDKLHYTLDDLLKSDSCFSLKRESGLCSLSLDFLKIDGEFCIIRQLFPYYSHAPIFNYVGTIIKVNRIYALNKDEIEKIEQSAQHN